MSGANTYYTSVNWGLGVGDGVGGVGEGDRQRLVSLGTLSLRHPVAGGRRSVVHRETGSYLWTLFGALLSLWELGHFPLSVLSRQERGIKPRGELLSRAAGHH